MRQGVAIVLAGIALAGAVYLASLNLARGGYLCGGVRSTGVIFSSSSGKSPCYSSGGEIDLYAPAKYVHYRAVWQIPVAIVIAALGFGAAVAIVRTPRSGR